MLKTIEDLKYKLKKNPHNYDLNLEYGLLYVKQKKYNKAEEIFSKLILIDDKRYEGFLNLSNIFLILKKFEKSELVLNKYIKKNNYNKIIINSLGILYLNIKDFKKLNNLIDKYIEKEENYFLFYLKSKFYENKLIIDKQIYFLIKTINTNKNFWLAYETLFNLYEKTNQVENFYNLVTKTKIIFGNDIKFKYYYALSLYRKNQFQSSLHVLKSEKIEDNFSKLNNKSYLINLYDLFSKIYLNINKNALSLEYSIKRNSTSIHLEENKKFDKQILLETVKKYNAFYSNYKKEKKIISYKNIFHENLVFLLGFPRSGTTLLDSILRSHSKTLVLEEKPYLINARQEYFKNNTLENFDNISENEKNNLQKRYFDSFDYLENKITIDKFPLNIIELGFIKKIFPQSKIILALRHPLDSILSCVLTSFKINEAMSNYENLETTASFYNEVFDLFLVYKKMLNISVYKIKYENVVTNFKFEINQLLSFLNLEFENSVINFHLTAKNRNKINTPSYHQVIKPIYRDSLNRYKSFEDINKIKPLVMRWIKEFDYTL